MDNIPFKKLQYDFWCPERVTLLEGEHFKLVIA